LEQYSLIRISHSRGGIQECRRYENRDITTWGKKYKSLGRTKRSIDLHPQVTRSYLVPILLKTFNILDILCNSSEPLRAEEIHIRTGYARTTVYRILRTLVIRGCVVEQSNLYGTQVLEKRLQVRAGILSPLQQRTNGQRQ
jgi:hypothetical protein